LATYLDDVFFLPPQIIIDQETIVLKELSTEGKSKIVYVADHAKSGAVSKIYSKCVFIIPKPGREEEVAQESLLCGDLARRCSSDYLAISMRQLKDSQDVFLADLAEGDMMNRDFQRYLQGNFAGTVRAFLDVCRSGYALHVEEIAHGDIKLENFLVFSDGKRGYTVKLSDWGKTKMLVEGKSTLMSGNASHSPPEQLTSCQGDVYGLGLVGIELLEIMLKIPVQERIATQLLPKKTTLSTLICRAAASAFGVTLTESKQESIHSHIDFLKQRLLEQGVCSVASLAMSSILKHMTVDDPKDRYSSGLAAYYLENI
jgi:serine/threonine protein kinase